MSCTADLVLTEMETTLVDCENAASTGSICTTDMNIQQVRQSTCRPKTGSAQK